MEEMAAALREMKICRFCLTEKEPLSNIYERDNKHSIPLPLQIMACVALEVFASDGMPQLICDDCRFQTRMSYSFKSMCKKSDDALKLFLATGVLNKPEKDSILEFQLTGQKRSAENDITSSEAKRTKKDLTTKDQACETEHNLIEESTQTDEVKITYNKINSEVVEPNIELMLPVIKPEEVEKVKQVPTQCFSCSECERSFPLQQLLDIHMRQHFRERKFNCKECNKRFFSKTDLVKHFLTHTGAKPFTCIVCDKTFSRQTLLHRHEKVHISVPKYLCMHCDKTYLSAVDLDQHIESHKKTRPYKCEYCDKNFAFKQGLERHELIHKSDHPHKCNYCSESFTTPGKLARHIQSHAGARPYPCKLCPKTFLLSHHLTRHLRNHYNKSSNSDDFKCDVCSMSFHKKEQLIEHTAIHSMVNLKCFICNREFLDAKSVKEHIGIHFTDLPYQCKKCEYSFEYIEELDEHEVKHIEHESDDENIPESNNDDSKGEVPHIRRSKRQTKIKNYADFLTAEIGTDSEEEVDDEEQENQSIKSSNNIQPLVRNEGVKVYKGREKQDVTKMDAFQSVKTDKKVSNKSLETATKTLTKITTLEDLGLSKSTLDVLMEKSGFVEMKIGQKVIRVQKLMMTKSDVHAMAKEGKIEMKGSTVVVKNSQDGELDINNLTQLNPEVKPQESSSIPSEDKTSDDCKMETLVHKTPLRTYKKKFTKAVSPENNHNLTTEHAENVMVENLNVIDYESEIDLKDSSLNPEIVTVNSEVELEMEETDD